MIGTKGVYTLKRVSLDFFRDGMVAPQIPLDLISEILTRLPTKSVLRFKCVCKEWYNHINSPLFELKSQHNCILYWTNSTLYVVDDLYHPVNVTKLNWPKDTIRDGDERISQVGSCNGLVCFNVIGSRRYDTMPCSTNKRFLICNPTTRTFKSICPPSEDTYLICGFGYDSEHDDYKIVGTPRCIWWEEDDINKPVFIYSLKTDLWSSHTPLRRISTTWTSWIIIGDVILENNNMLHFLVSPIRQGSIERKIARFDVVSEKWIDGLSLPVQVSEFNHCYVRLGKLDGRLYLHDLHSNDIWMMEEDGSWKKKMFNLPEILEWHHVIARSKDRRHRLLLHDYYGDGDVLKWFDQRNNKTIPLILKPSPEDRSTIMLCTATLIGIPGCSLKIKVAGNEGVRSSVLLSFTCLLCTLSVLVSFYLLYSFTRFM